VSLWHAGQEEAGPVLLVVDDREENLVAMEALLGDGPWAVRTANSGEAALRRMMEENVGLVLLDVQMPGMDGFEVARLMRGSPRTRYIPIIFLSAIAHTQMAVLRGYAAGAVDFILKPFDPSVLRYKIRDLLEREQQRYQLQLVSRQLEREKAFSASLLDNASEGILVADAAGLIRFANPAMARMLERPLAELQGAPLLDHLNLAEHPENWQDSSLYQAWRESRSYRTHEAALRRRSGSVLPVALSCSPLPQVQNAMVLIASDMSQISELHARLEAQAVTDALTGLYNRRGFHQALETSLARSNRNGQRLAVIYLDLDGFKRINDSLGHAAGDQLLSMVAIELRGALRPYDVLARVGGDEFVILLDSLESTDDAARVAEKLIELVSVRHRVDGMEVTLGASVGIACFPECGSTVESLLRSADMAMYEAKRAGRRQYRFFEREMNDQAHARLLFEESLRQAIDQRDFSLIYQPQIEMPSGRLRGFEALLRWRHRVAGSIAPGSFIPLLEETRLINRLGEWIFDEALAQCRLWTEQRGRPLLLSVNISPVQLAMPELVTQLDAALRRHQVAPEQLEVEVTETALMQDLELARQQLGRLRALGVRIAIDDFGTGHSSLAYLRHFEVDTLKIDRLFITNMLGSAKDAAIVSTILALAGHLELDVVAEGVENRAQQMWLAEQGCQALQGFLVAPGLSAEKALAFPLQLQPGALPPLESA